MSDAAKVCYFCLRPRSDDMIEMEGPGGIRVIGCPHHKGVLPPTVNEHTLPELSEPSSDLTEEISQ